MFRFMAQRSARVIPVDLRARLETARLDLLALFRALDRMDLSATETHSGYYVSFLSSMPILRKPSGLWTNPRDVWMSAPCCATLWRHSINCQQPLPDFGKTFPGGRTPR